MVFPQTQMEEMGDCVLVILDFPQTQMEEMGDCVLVVRIPFRLQVLESSQCSLISERRIRLQMEELDKCSLHPADLSGYKCRNQANVACAPAKAPHPTQQKTAPAQARAVLRLMVKSAQEMLPKL